MALGLVYMALIARITRATMLDVLSQDYVRTAKAKGLPEYRAVVKYPVRIKCAVLGWNTLLEGLNSAGA